MITVGFKICNFCNGRFGLTLTWPLYLTSHGNQAEVTRGQPRGEAKAHTAGQVSCFCAKIKYRLTLPKAIGTGKIG